MSLCMSMHIGISNRIVCVFLTKNPAMQDPLKLLGQQHSYDPDRILASARGEAYTAIMLANGQIGICSSIGARPEADPLDLDKPDLGNPDHRVIALAYANAVGNYGQDYPDSGDIFELIDFSLRKNNVMIGFFPPLVDKFRAAGIPVTIFDQHGDHPGLAPQERILEDIAVAGCVIMSSTTLINSTFPAIIQAAGKGTEILLLGPSTPLDPVMKKDYRVTRLFGMVFRPFDFELLGIIGKGSGTQTFSKRGKKVSL